MEDRSTTSSATKEITQYLNVTNAKLVALVMIIAFIMYHGTLRFKYGNDSCKWLLSDGRFSGSNTWQPYGCMMHKYRKADARTCMHYVSYWGGHNHFAFIGDSRIRQLYWEMVRLISEEEVKEAELKHNDFFFSDNKINIKIDFLWHPMVNLSMYDVYHKWLKSDQPGARPNVVITGSATWSIKMFNGSKSALDNFLKMVIDIGARYPGQMLSFSHQITQCMRSEIANLTSIQNEFTKLKDSTKVLWMLQDPVEEERLASWRKMITNEQIDLYNKVAINALKESSALVWSSSRLVAQGMKKELTTDGIHIQKPALDIDIQMLLNMYCNNDMNHDDGTCCNTPEKITTLQIITATAFLICMLLYLGIVIYRRRTPRNGNKARACENGQRNGQANPQEINESIYEVVSALSKLGLIMAYFFICDRTTFFMKENKYYANLNFFLPFAYVMILGLFFTENTDKTTCLHRDQTDEWKGWMQLVILIYHLTGASKVLPIYMHIRVLVSSYLFLTGFGHFCYYWEKGEFGFPRYCMVLFRMNLLVASLCFTMNRPYQFYYFVPLVSFWFLVIYLVMAIPPNITRQSSEASPMHYLYMIFKFIALIVAISLFFLSEVFFEKVFLTRPIKALFVTSDDSIHEWRFRWQLDRFSVVYGMLFAFGYKVLVRYRIIPEDSTQNLFSNTFSWVLCVLSVIGLSSYTLFSVLCNSKVQCNDVHSYLVFLPIISFIILRNVPGYVRTRYSAFFAWFGKISLELFICQYHIWMAADTHGILVLIPSYPVLNVIITSFIFIVISHEVNVITMTLVKYAVPTEFKALLRNFLLFIGVLMLLCYVNGLIVL